MATRRIDYPIGPMTLENVRHNGVRSLWVQCYQYRHEKILSVDHLPGDLPSFGPRMFCTRCGADVGRIGGTAAGDRLPATSSEAHGVMQRHSSRGISVGANGLGGR